MKKILAIALNTFRESVRSKVLYAVLFFALLMLLLSTFFGTVTIGDQIRVIKDFGLFSISIFSVAYVVIAGASLLDKELMRKTIYNILGKAVTRSEFIIGKYLGLLMTSSTLVILMTPCLMLYLSFFENKVDYMIVYASIFMILELTIVCAAAIFFSSIVVTPILSGLFTFGIFLAGRSVQYLGILAEQGIEGLPKTALQTLGQILPNLDKLNVANEAIYLDINAINTQKFIWSSLYALSYAAILLILSNIIFKQKEFN